MDARCGGVNLRAAANALSIPPGEYGRKVETQRNGRGPAQAVEHVVQFDATRRTLPGFDMLVVGNRKGTEPRKGKPAQVLHGCRQQGPCGDGLSPGTNGTP